MNNFINTLLAFVLVLSSSSLTAQREYKENFSSGTVYFRGINELKIQAYDGNEVKITSDEEEEEKSERAKGLKLLNGLGLDDNTGFGISVTKEDGNLIVQQIGKRHDSDEIFVQVPRNVNVDVQHVNNAADDLFISGVSAEIVVNVLFNDVKLTNVSGPMTVKSVHGDIDVVFDKPVNDGSISINSIHGDLDVTVPSSQKANLTLVSTHGNVYSDVDVAIKNSADKGTLFGQAINGTIAGGGIKIYLNANHGDIFLRKAK